MPASETTNPDAKSARMSSQSCGSKACHQPCRGGRAKELAPVAPVGEHNMGRHPTSKARRKRQKIKRKYARFREDAQLAGEEPVLPAGAIKPERVDPST